MLQMTVSVLGFSVGLVVWGFLLVFHLSVLQLILLSWVSQQLRCPLDPAGPLGAAFNGSFLCAHKRFFPGRFET